MTTPTPIMTTTVPGQHTVETVGYIGQPSPSRYNYTVTYGHQIKHFHTLMQAISEHQSCVIHAITCNGAFDDDN